MKISVILFDGFELLDVFGPVELFSFVEDWKIEYVGPVQGLVKSSQGAQVFADTAYDQLKETDLLLVPGGRGTRALVKDVAFLAWLLSVGESAQWVASVCTGSALLAAAGLLDGFEATSNKRAFDWASSLGEGVEWRERARWVHSGNRWTSSGISAGIDMAAALIENLKGPKVAEKICVRAEILPHTGPSDDPFARS